MAEIPDMIPAIVLDVNHEELDICEELFTALDIQFSCQGAPLEAEIKLYFEEQSQRDEYVEAMQEDRFGLADMLGRIPAFEVTEIKREDWSEVWKEYFHPMRVSDRVVIKPSWETFVADEEDLIIEIDPGMSFGTGQHGTTMACIQLLDALSLQNPFLIEDHLLDIGCGSGILAIAAGKMGFKNIDAFDFDPDAVKIANENLEINQINQCKATVDDISTYIPSKEYQVVVANLETHILLPNMQNILNCLDANPGAILILSGILDTEFYRIEEAFQVDGLELVNTALVDEWRTGFFIRSMA